MKKLFLIGILLLTTHCLFSQNIGFGIQGGVNMASINPNAPQSSGGSSQAHATFQFGATLDVRFKSLTLQSGLLLTGKGNTSTTVQNLISNGKPVPYYLTNSTNISYIELPVNLLYQRYVKPGTLYFGAGPYLAQAIWGSYTTKMNINEYYKHAVSTDISFGNSDDQLKSIDYGANILAGLLMNNGLKLGLNYGLGFSNIANTGGSSQNRALSLVIGYNFK